MKPFDKEAAMQGAAVCTEDGRPVRILCFDCECVDGPIIALCKNSMGIEQYGCFNYDGIAAHAASKFNLHMQHDDYNERLNQWLHAPIMTHPLAIPPVADQVEFCAPMTRRDWFAGLAMQGIMAANEHGIGNLPGKVAQRAVALADALCVELDNTRQLNTK